MSGTPVQVRLPAEVPYRNYDEPQDDNQEPSMYVDSKNTDRRDNSEGDGDYDVLNSLYQSKRKDYSHLEPPLALPSRQEFASPAKDDDALEGSFNSKVHHDDQVKEALKDNDYEQPGWYKDDPRNYAEEEDAAWPSDDFEGDSSVLFTRKKKMDAGGSAELTNSAKMIKSGPHPRFRRPVGLTSNSKEREPDPIYLPVGQKQGNVLYSSLIDMINVAENLRVKRPSNSDDEDFDDVDSDEESTVLTFEGAEQSSNQPQGTVQEHLHPQVARIQDRGLNSDEDDWTLPRVGPWDPADTPVATAVLGSVMLFLILVVVRLMQHQLIHRNV